jgi:hypothetical protein
MISCRARSRIHWIEGGITEPSQFISLFRSKRDAILASDRPFRRQAIKLLTRLLLGRRRAHYHSWLPSLRIEGRAEGRPGEVIYRREKVLDLLDIDALVRRAGKRILVIGSGPSVKELSPRSLPARCALLLNGAINLMEQGLTEPLAVAMEDERFVWRHFEVLARNVPRDVPMLLSPGVIRAICDHDAGFLKERPVILIDDLRKPFGHPRREEADLAGRDYAVLRGGAGFSSEPDKGVFPGGSVVVSAVQFALATRAAEIGFIGVDIANADAPRFYEQKGAAAFSGVARAEKRILDHIALASDIAAYRGVRLVNHSPVSALRSIGLDYVPLGTSER